MEINHYLATETFLKMEFEWLEKIIQLRVGSYFNTAAETPSIEDVKPPIIGDESTYERFLLHYDLGFMERVIVAMIAASTLKPEVFDVLLTKIQDSAVVHVEFGGTIKERRFIPTFRTAAFILNESKDALPLILNPIFELSHPFTYFSLLDFSGTTFHTQIDSILCFSPEMEYQLFTGNVYQPKFNHEFPAKALTTKLNWEDLVVSVSVSENLHAMLQWFQMQKNIEQNVHLAKWLKPGFRVLFYGPSGTGKTLAASLVGKTANLPVYSVDLSMVVSKYIGETEKILAKLFSDSAELLRQFASLLRSLCFSILLFACVCGHGLQFRAIRHEVNIRAIGVYLSSKVGFVPL